MHVHPFCKEADWGDDLNFVADALLGNNKKGRRAMFKFYEILLTKISIDDYISQMEKFGIGSIDTCLKCKDGQIIDVYLSSTPIDPTELSAGITFTALDITERKKAEGALRESEERFRRIFTQAFDAIVIINENGYIIDINEAACSLLGFAKKELVERSLKEIHPEKESKKFSIFGRVSFFQKLNLLTFQIYLIFYCVIY